MQNETTFDRKCAPILLDELPFCRIEEYLEERASLIVPLGVLEPLGDDLPVGALNRCCTAIAHAMSARMDVVVAPTLPYGNSTPFTAFGGCAGVRRDTFASFLHECLRAWLIHGFNRIMVLSVAMDGAVALESVVRQITKRGLCDKAVQFCSLQGDERFRELCALHVSDGATDIRCERGLRALAIAAGVKSAPRTPGTFGTGRVAADAETVGRWRRRGRDPEKLRKLVPGARFYQDGNSIITPDAACAFFEQTVSFLCEEFSPFLTAEDNASR